MLLSLGIESVYVNRGLPATTNRHCPKCEGPAARAWMAARAAELLPVPYFHAVFTLLSPIGDIACQNKAALYNRV